MSGRPTGDAPEARQFRNPDGASLQAGARPKLLFLCQTLPYPPDAGVAIRTYNVLRLLARTFDVTALCFYRWKGGLEQSDVPGSQRALAELATVQVFPILQEHSRPRMAWDHLRSLALGRVYTEFVHDSHDFRAAVDAAIASGRFQLVHVDSLDLSAYLPRLGHVPVICVHHNVESRLLARRATVERTASRRWYVRHQAALMEDAERQWCGRVALNITVSDADADQLRVIAPQGRYLTVPNGVDVGAFRPAAGSGKGVVYVGGTTWFPNRDALDYWSAEIHPLFRQLVGDVPVQWVGRATEQEQRQFAADPGIELTGYVQDVRPYVHDAGCFIVPLRIGGGTRLKILDAWAMGKAVVSTSIGCEGLRAVDGQNILIRDSPKEFAEAVALVLRDAALRERLGAAARQTVEETYSWEVLSQPMIEAYLGVIAGLPPTG